MGLVFWALKVWLYYISHLAIAKEASDTQKLGCMASWHILKPYQIVKLSAMPQKSSAKRQLQNIGQHAVKVKLIFGAQKIMSRIRITITITMTIVTT